MAFNEPGKGGLFPNRYYEEGSNKPTMRGELFAHRDLKKGERIELAAWPHKTGPGMSLKAQDPRIPETKPVADTARATSRRDEAPADDDTIPF